MGTMSLYGLYRHKQLTTLIWQSEGAGEYRVLRESRPLEALQARLAMRG
jgi:hypothetical protein